MDKVYQLYINDKITVDGFGERYKPMEDQLGQLREEIPKLEAEVDFLKVNFLSSDQILTEAKNLANFWPEMNRESKRQVVENIVEKITLGRNDIQIDLFYLPVADPLDDQSDESQNNEPPDDGLNSNGNIDSDSNTNPDLQSPVDSATSTNVSSKKSIAPYFYKNMAKRCRAVEGTEIIFKLVSLKNPVNPVKKLVAIFRQD